MNKDMTLDELILLKKLLPKLTKIIDTGIEAKRYEDFDYTPRSTTAYKRAKERTEVDNIPQPIWKFIKSLPLDRKTLANYTYEGRNRLNKYSLKQSKHILQLHYISGMSQREIARHVQLRQATISYRLTGLRKIVREGDKE